MALPNAQQQRLKRVARPAQRLDGSSLGLQQHHGQRVGVGQGGNGPLYGGRLQAREELVGAGAQQPGQDGRPGGRGTGKGRRLWSSGGCRQGWIGLLLPWQCRRAGSQAPRLEQHRPGPRIRAEARNLLLPLASASTMSQHELAHTSTHVPCSRVSHRVQVRKIIQEYPGAKTGLQARRGWAENGGRTVTGLITSHHIVISVHGQHKTVFFLEFDLLAACLALPCLASLAWPAWPPFFHDVSSAHGQHKTAFVF